MKNLSLILNIILLLAVGVLYYLHFSKQAVAPISLVQPAQKSDDSASVSPIVISGAAIGSNKIVFIDYDSLMMNYDYYKKIEKDLQAKIRSSEIELMQKEQKLQKDYEFYQQSQAQMTEQHRATKEQQLMAENQSLMELKERKSEQLATQQQDLNDKLLNNLYGYFNRLGKQNGFSYIFTYKRGQPGLVYGNDSLDITKQIVEGLNKEYREKNKK